MKTDLNVMKSQVEDIIMMDKYANYIENKDIIIHEISNVHVPGSIDTEVLIKISADPDDEHRFDSFVNLMTYYKNDGECAYIRVRYRIENATHEINVKSINATNSILDETLITIKRILMLALGDDNTYKSTIEKSGIPTESSDNVSVQELVRVDNDSYVYEFKLKMYDYI